MGLDGSKESCFRWWSRGAKDIAIATSFGMQFAVIGFV